MNYLLGMHEAVIRRALAGDLENVISLLDEVDALHRQALPWLLREAEGANRVEFLANFVTRQDHSMFVAVGADGSFAGVVYAFLRPAARAPIVRPAVVAELDCLAVSSSHRRQQVGTGLVHAVLEWANTCGASRTELGVYEFNHAARAFWATLGFETLSRRLVLHSRAEQPA